MSHYPFVSFDWVAATTRSLCDSKTFVQFLCISSIWTLLTYKSWPLPSTVRIACIFDWKSKNINMFIKNYQETCFYLTLPPSQEVQTVSFLWIYNVPKLIFLVVSTDVFSSIQFSSNKWVWRIFIFLFIENHLSYSHKAPPFHFISHISFFLQERKRKDGKKTKQQNYKKIRKHIYLIFYNRRSVFFKIRYFK